MQMEKLEMELIKKLQNTQAVQKEAYTELERALKEPSATMAYNSKSINNNSMWEAQATDNQKEFITES